MAPWVVMLSQNSKVNHIHDAVHVLLTANNMLQECFQMYAPQTCHAQHQQQI